MISGFTGDRPRHSTLSVPHQERALPPGSPPTSGRQAVKPLRKGFLALQGSPTPTLYPLCASPGTGTSPREPSDQWSASCQAVEEGVSGFTGVPDPDTRHNNGRLSPDWPRGSLFPLSPVCPSYEGPPHWGRVRGLFSPFGIGATCLDAVRSGRLLRAWERRPSWDTGANFGV